MASQSTTSFTFEAIGTQWLIDIDQPTLLASQQVDWLSQIMTFIDQYDRVFSRFRPDSTVSAMAKAAGSYQLPDYSQPLLQAYQQLYQATDGQLTPLIGQTMADAGYDSQYTFVSHNPQPAPAWANLLTYDHPQLSLSQPALLDFGAAGKGYLVDLVAQLLIKLGSTSFCINAGGDIYHYHQPIASSQGLKIALEHPQDPQQAIGIATINNQSLCASSGNRRRWANYTHIINPQTVDSPQHILATWVVADTALQADGLATALFFTTADQLLLSYDFDYAIIYADTSMRYSPTFPADFF